VFGIDIEFYTEKKDEKLCFVCTMQISTISHDFIIDAIKLRKEISTHLKNTLFENSQKIKIFHGCDTDLKMLKVDFNFYP
jgi:exosome complex exonuclease RRP6